jgi:hypothetical protein
MRICNRNALNPRGHQLGGQSRTSAEFRAAGAQTPIDWLFANCPATKKVQWAKRHMAVVAAPAFSRSQLAC